MSNLDKSQGALPFVQWRQIGSAPLSDHILSVMPGHSHPRSLLQVRHDARYSPALGSAGQGIDCPPPFRPVGADDKIELPARTGTHIVSVRLRGDSPREVDFDRAVDSHQILLPV